MRFIHKSIDINFNKIRKLGYVCGTNIQNLLNMLIKFYFWNFFSLNIFKFLNGSNVLKLIMYKMIRYFNQLIQKAILDNKV